MDYVRAVDDYLLAAGVPLRRAARRSRPRALAPLDYFINESHEGYCQHYAGAMALMLRMGGIPARVATGFSPGGYSDRKKAWIVRDTDAHAWVEIWFDEYGWVTVDPTPSATPSARWSPRWRPTWIPPARARRPTPVPTTPPAATRRPSASARSCRPAASASGRVAAEEGGTRWWLYALGVDRGGSALVLADRALPAPPARPDADGPRDRRRSRTRCAGSGGRSRPGRR